MRRRAGALAAMVVALLVGACGAGDDDGSADAQAILREYALTARDLVEGWPPPQAAPEIARLSLDTQRPRVDGVARLAERAQALADDAEGDRASAYAALASAIGATHADLARKLEVIGRDEYWSLDFYCGGLDDTIAAARAQSTAIDGVIALLDVDAPPDLLSREGGLLATVARCRDAVNEASRPLASPAGGFTAGMEQRADHVHAAVGQLRTTLQGFESTDALVIEGHDALRELVATDVLLFEAARAFEPAAGQSTEASAAAFREANAGRAGRPGEGRGSVVARLAAHRRRGAARRLVASRRAARVRMIGHDRLVRRPSRASLQPVLDVGIPVAVALFLLLVVGEEHREEAGSWERAVGSASRSRRAASCGGGARTPSWCWSRRSG